MKKEIECYHDEQKKPDHCRETLANIARHFGVPYSTLWYRVTGKVQGVGHQSGGKNKSKLLPTAAEKDLAERISEYLGH